MLIEELQHTRAQQESAATLAYSLALADERRRTVMFGTLDLSHFAGTGIGLALGLLVGIQRGWSLRAQAAGTRFAGIRTFGLLGLAGGIAGTLYAHAASVAFVLMTTAAVLVVIGYYRMSKNGDLPSGTASMVGLLTIACGFLAGSGERLLGTAIAVAMVMLLALRERLHDWVGRLTEQEVLAIARFALIAMVILPLLPNEQYGPYLAWNPRQLWLIVVLVSGLSFAGYFAAKRLGASRANIATAAAGAVVSSTAVTATMATRMRNNEGQPAILAAAVSVASVVMYLRVLVLVLLLAPFALRSLAELIAPAMLVSLAAAAWFFRVAIRQTEPQPQDLTLRNPFDILPAMILAGLVMVLTVVAHWVLEAYGDRGLALVLAISGSVDVDSAIITMGNLPPGTLDPAIAGLVLAAPVTLNTLFKGGVALSIARWEGGRALAVPLFASAFTTGVAYLLVR